MNRGIVLAALTLTALVATTATASADGTVCYNLVGGTYCAEEGSARAAQFAADQAAYYAEKGRPDPGPFRPDASASTTTTVPPVDEQCFILVGGTMCYPRGSASAAAAAEAEAAHLASSPTTYAPPTSAESVTEVVEEIVEVVEHPDAAVEEAPTVDAEPIQAHAPSPVVLPETR